MNRVTIILGVLAISTCSLAGQTKSRSKQTKSAAPAGVIPAEWYPALHPSLETLLEQLKNANSQQEMNALSRKIADVRDAQLFIAYMRLYDRLGAKERTALVQEQAAWLKKRAKRAEEAVTSKGGSLAPLEANDAEATLTEQRLIELRDRLKKLQRK